MDKFHCPGQELPHWKAKDIIEVRCPHCDEKIEFFKDDPVRACPSCHQEVRNPSQNISP